MEGEGPAWVTASGVRGATKITIPLSSRDSAERRYTVRLWFSVLPGEPASGPFTAVLQGKPIGDPLELPAAGERVGAGKVVEFGGVAIGKELEIELTGNALLCGVEVVAEEE